VFYSHARPAKSIFFGSKLEGMGYFERVLLVDTLFRRFAVYFLDFFGLHILFYYNLTFTMLN
jgi:hypothetical protein